MQCWHTAPLPLKVPANTTAAVASTSRDRGSAAAGLFWKRGSATLPAQAQCQVSWSGAEQGASWHSSHHAGPDAHPLQRGQHVEVLQRAPALPGEVNADAPWVQVSHCTTGRCVNGSPIGKQVQLSALKRVDRRKQASISHGAGALATCQVRQLAGHGVQQRPGGRVWRASGSHQLELLCNGVFVLPGSCRTIQSPSTPCTRAMRLTPEIEYDNTYQAFELCLPLFVHVVMAKGCTGSTANLARIAAIAAKSATTRKNPGSHAGAELEVVTAVILVGLRRPVGRGLGLHISFSRMSPARFSSCTSS